MFYFNKAEFYDFIFAFNITALSSHKTLNNGRVVYRNAFIFISECG